MNPELVDNRAQPPRLVVLDPTPIGSLCATGQFKRMLFQDWPREAILEITTDLESGGHVVARKGFGDFESLSDPLAMIGHFGGEAVYLRPEPENYEHFDVALALLKRCDLPVILHIMDDWVAGEFLTDPGNKSALRRVAQKLAGRAAIRFTDGPAYVQDFATRLETPFDSLLNGVDIEAWPTPTALKNTDAPFTLTHMGGYDELMSRRAIIDIAETVEELSREFPIRFHAHLPSFALAAARRDLGRLKATHLFAQQRDFSAYVNTLCASDLNVYAYNSDPRSVQYMGKGIPNKTCELMAARKPILAYGPPQFSGLQYLQENAGAFVATHRDDLKDTIRRVRAAPQLAETAAQRAFEWVKTKHDAAAIRGAFIEAAQSIVDTRRRLSAEEFEVLEADWASVRVETHAKRRSRLRRAALRRTARAFPFLIVRAVLRLRENPFPLGLVALLCASFVHAKGEAVALVGGAGLGGLGWIGAQVAARLAELVAEEVLEAGSPKRAAVLDGVAACTTALWPLAASVATGAIAGALAWDRLGAVGVACAGLVSAFAACGARGFARYRRRMSAQIGALGNDMASTRS